MACRSFEGAGVYYGATFMEAQLCRGEEVVVVGGGNSAGQAAVYLAQTAKRVHMLVRSSGLAESMSRYLIRRIEQNPAIVLRTHTEIVETRRNQPSRAGALARRSDRRNRNPRYPPRLRHDRRRSRHPVARLDASPSTPKVSSRPGRICRRTIWPPRAGRSPGRPIFSKPVCPECSRSATSGAAISSVSRRPWARARSRSPSSIRCCPNRRTMTMAEATCAHIEAITTVKHAKRRQVR